MKQDYQWGILIVLFVTLIAGSFGCATLTATTAAKNNEFYTNPVISDEIIAIGKPDAALSKAIGHDHVVAFLGKKNTYMLYKGGEELEHISTLHLYGKRLVIDTTTHKNLYVKDKQVWGYIVLTYAKGLEITPEEQEELIKSGFSQPEYRTYQKKIEIAGIITPAIQLTDQQIATLATTRPFNLYNPRDVKAPSNIGATMMIPFAVAADIVLSPFYLGVGLILLIAL
ncbi:MAG: hypothetical protein ABL919_07590 [Methylococcales bacterium]|nr:hypothetical protein [Methylococcaceae bacterium]